MNTHLSGKGDWGDGDQMHYRQARLLKDRACFMVWVWSSAVCKGLMARCVCDHQLLMPIDCPRNDCRLFYGRTLSRDVHCRHPAVWRGGGGQVFFSLLPPMSLGGRLHEVILYVSVWIKSIHPCLMLNMHLQIIAQARQLHDTKLGSPVCITFCTPQKQLLSLYQRLAPLWPTTQQPVNPFLLVGSQ